MRKITDWGLKDSCKTYSYKLDPQENEVWISLND